MAPAMFDLTPLTCPQVSSHANLASLQSSVPTIGKGIGSTGSMQVSFALPMEHYSFVWVPAAGHRALFMYSSVLMCGLFPDVPVT
jgi:hypothetical protein